MISGLRVIPLHCNVQSHSLSFAIARARRPFTVLHFSAKLALLRVLKQRLVVLHVVPHLAARLVEQGAVPARCRALVEKKTHTHKKKGV